MFERLNDRAMKAVLLAQEEAHSMRHASVESGHLLLGLMRIKKGLAVEALRDAGCNLVVSRSSVQGLYPRGEFQDILQLPFSARFSRVLEMAWDSAKELGQLSISTENLLIGLIDSGDDVLLKNLGEPDILCGIRNDLLIRSADGAQDRWHSTKRTLSSESLECNKYARSPLLYILGRLQVVEGSRDEYLQGLTICVGTCLKLSRCLLLLNEKKESYFISYEYLRDDKILSCKDLNWPHSSPAVLKSLADIKVTMMLEVESLAKNSVWAKELNRVDIKTMLVVPLRSEKDWLGCLLLQQCDFERNWIDEDLNLIEAIGYFLKRSLSKANE